MSAGSMVDSSEKLLLFCKNRVSMISELSCCSIKSLTIPNNLYMFFLTFPTRNKNHREQCL